jgi:hypothetical protein
MLKFSTKQNQFIQNGAAKRKRLIQLAEKAASSNLASKYRHTYIYSPPGLGKTYSVEKAVAKTGIDYHTISGNISMFSFGIALAVINYSIEEGKPVVIIVDDCDEILKGEANINIMKNILSMKNCYAYEKSLQNQWNNLSELQQIAVEAHSSENQMGFTVPTDRFMFIMTSNFKLPTDDDVLVAEAKGKNVEKKRHLNAIRSRFKTADFDLNSDEHWGWIADVVLNEKCVDLDKESKVILLDWMQSNWDDMTERSIRTAEKMAESMIDDPTAYRDNWEIDYLKNK